MADIEYSTRAADWLRKADPTAKEQVRKRLEQAADFPDHFLEPLTGSSHYKLRAGDYRAEVNWKRDDDVLFVRDIGHRRNFWD